MSWGEIIWQNNLIKTNAQIFTSNGNFIVPNNVKTIYITACAGGGGGGGYRFHSGSYDRYYGGNGGYGGDYVIRRPFEVTPKQSISITIGKGGAGGARDSNGTKGGSTIISNLITILGGDGGLVGGSYVSWSTTNGGRGGEGGLCNEVATAEYDVSAPEDGQSLFASGSFSIQGYIIPGYGGISQKIRFSKEAYGGGGGASLGNGGSEYYGGDGSFVRIAPRYGGGGLGGSSETAIGQTGADGICIIEWGLNI